MAMEESKHLPGPGVYVRVCGGKPWPGIFLYRMAFLNTKAKIEVDGYGWYVLSRDEALKYWGCSQRQYDNAMRFLREERLIETRYTKGFKGRTSYRTTSFRLTNRAIEQVKFEAARGHRAQREAVAAVGEEMRAYDRKERPIFRESGRTTGDAIGCTGGDAIGRITSGANIMKEESEGEKERINLFGGERREEKQREILVQEPTRRRGRERQAEKAKVVEKAFSEAWLEFTKHKHVWQGWSRKESRLGVMFVQKLNDANLNTDKPVSPLAVINMCVRRWKYFREFAFDTYREKCPDQPNMMSLLGAIRSASEFYCKEQAKIVPITSAKPKLSVDVLKNVGNPQGSL